MLGKNLQHAVFIFRFAGFPCRSALGQNLLNRIRLHPLPTYANDGQPPVRDIDFDEIALLHQRDRALFFIVLDLRLTKVGARRCSFFYVYISA